MKRKEQTKKERKQEHEKSGRKEVKEKRKDMVGESLELEKGQLLKYFSPLITKRWQKPSAT